MLKENQKPDILKEIATLDINDELMQKRKADTRLIQGMRDALDKGVKDKNVQWYIAIDRLITRATDRLKEND